MGIIDCLYFSVVTITTLGYGDILPESTFLKVLISFQSLIGVALFGLLVNSFWVAYQEAVDKEMFERDIDHHLGIIEDYLSSLKLIIGEITTTDAVAYSGVRRNEAYLDHEFKFSALATIFEDTRNSELIHQFGFFQSKLRVFYYIDDQLIDELRHLKIEWSLKNHRVLRNTINNFLKLKSHGDIKATMLRHDEGAVILRDKLYKDIVKVEIAKHAERPDHLGLHSEILYFYDALVTKIICIHGLEKEIKNIRARSSNS